MEELELQIKLWHKENQVGQKLEAIPGIRPITASAAAVALANKNARIIWALLAKGTTFFRSMIGVDE